MKDHVEIGNLTKYGAFRMNRDQVMDLEIWFKIHTNIFNFETKSYKLLKYFMLSVILCKMSKHSDFHLSNRRCMTRFYSCHKTDKKNLRVYVVLGDAFSKLETFVWILNRISRFT